MESMDYGDEDEEYDDERAYGKEGQMLFSDI